MSELIFIVGCNAAGKSTFIRGRLNKLNGFEIFMTDVYKSRTKDLIKQAIRKNKNILVENVFNDSSFKDLVDIAKEAGYKTSLVVLFLDSVQQSLSRVTFRIVQQSGVPISEGNVKINFIEGFKNIANYFFYFDRSDFIYTGEGSNKLIMSFQNGEIIRYSTSNLIFPQNFAKYSFANGRLDNEANNIIVANDDFVKILPAPRTEAKFEI